MDIKQIIGDRTQARLIYNIKTKEILGLFYEWRKNNPDACVGLKYDLNTIEIGKSAKRYEIETIKALSLEGTHKEMIDRADKQDKARYEAAKPKAEKLLDDAGSGIREILKKTGCNLSYSMHGDTYGIYEDYQYLSVEIDGCYFERKLNY